MPWELMEDGFPERLPKLIIKIQGSNVKRIPNNPFHEKLTFHIRWPAAKDKTVVSNTIEEPTSAPTLLTALILNNA